MRVLERDVLATIGGGRSAARTVRDYGLACLDGAVQATVMTGGTVAPYTLGVGCAAGMAGQGLSDAIDWYRNRGR